LEEKIMLLY